MLKTSCIQIISRAQQIPSTVCLFCLFGSCVPADWALVIMTMRCGAHGCREGKDRTSCTRKSCHDSKSTLTTAATAKVTQCCEASDAAVHPAGLLSVSPAAEGESGIRQKLFWEVWHPAGRWEEVRGKKETGWWEIRFSDLGVGRLFSAKARQHELVDKTFSRCCDDDVSPLFFCSYVFHLP